MGTLRDWLMEHGWSSVAATITAVIAAILAAYVLGWVLRLSVRGLPAQALQSKGWKEALERQRVIPAIVRVVFVALAFILAVPLLEPWPRLVRWAETLFSTALVVTIAMALNRVVAAFFDVLQRHREKEQRLPFRALAQSTQLAIWVYAVVALLSLLTGRDIWAVLTGLTAIGAILVYVFRDPILGWTAAVQIATNDLMREGDWISVPKHDTDGTVEEIALTSIKVRNWDKTVSAVPTYVVFSEGFRNWRGMYESGVRRIKRAIAVDVTTVRFSDPAMQQRLREDSLLAPLIPGEEHRGDDPSIESRSTNLGLFRAWLESWLRQHPSIDETSTLLVRELEPDGRGLPVEIYAFSKEIRWAQYERLQADIYDYALALLPEFGLRPFQEPGAEDLGNLAAALTARGPAEQPSARASGGTTAPK